MSISNEIGDLSILLDSVLGMTFVMLGIIFMIYGIYKFGTIIFRTDTDTDDHMGVMMKSMMGIIIGGAMIGSNMNSESVNVLKYIGIGICGLVVAVIIGSVTIFLLNKKKYKKYIKKTNELLLLTDDFLILSNHLQNIEEQIILNAKMAEDLASKKKEELTFLNSLLTEKRIRFNGMVADIRASISI